MRGIRAFVQRREVVVDGALRRRRRVHAAQFEQLLARQFVLTEGEVRTRHVQPRAEVVGLQGEHAFEGQRRTRRLTALQRRQTEQVVELDFAGAGLFGGDQLAVGLARLAAADQFGHLAEVLRHEPARSGHGEYKGQKQHPRGRAHGR